MPKDKTIILNSLQIQQKINRIAYEIYENYPEEKKIFLIGIANRGSRLAERIAEALKAITPLKPELAELKMDKRNPVEGDIEANIDPAKLKGRIVVLVDDVLDTGRTLAYGVRYLTGFPIKGLTTVVMVNRRHRMFPIRADFVGLTLATTIQEHISVEIGKGKEAVYLS